MQTQTPRAINPDRFQSDHSRWRALTQRSPSSHSAFLYGVKSTKIYCRPTCPARLARRANVIFFDTEDQALHDGYRPCKRCQPDNVSFRGEKEEVVTRVLSLLRTKRDGLTVKRNLKQLADEVGVTPSYLCRVFKKTMGVTLGAYMVEFERDTSESNTNSSSQSPSALVPGVVNPVTGILTPAIAEGSLPVPIDGLNREFELADQQVENFAETLDLNFDFDTWFLTGGFDQNNFWNQGFLDDGSLNPDVLDGGFYGGPIQGG